MASRIKFKLNVAVKTALDTARANHPFIRGKWISDRTLYQVIRPLVVLPTEKTFEFNQFNNSLSLNMELKSNITSFENDIEI